MLSESIESAFVLGVYKWPNVWQIENIIQVVGGIFILSYDFQSRVFNYEKYICVEKMCSS